MGLTLTVLGCSGSYAGVDNACSGYLVRSGATTVWLDCGPGTLANLQRHADLTELDAVVVTHSHPDHMAEVAVAHAAWKYYRSPGRPVPVFAPAPVRRLTEEILGTDTGETLAWTVVADGDRVEVGALAFSFSRTDHPVETLATRVDGGGRSFGYSADTGPGWGLAALGPGLDVALCEAGLSADQEGMTAHLSARQAAATARDAGVERLLLTHIPPTIDPEAQRREAAASFDGRVELARIHESYEL